MKFRRLLLALLCVTAFAGGAAVAADDLAGDLAEVTRLYHAGQTDAALQRADTYLAAHPRDPQMRFLEAVILADAQRRSEAVAVLEKLTQDYPDLAEPYNNLAALYAANGDYEKARAALQQALRLNPNYATAHENLGDVYAALAGESYADALRLDPGRAGVAAKIERVRALVASTRTGVAAVPAASAASAAAPR